MAYEELQRALSTDIPEIVVRAGDRTIGLLELAAMSGDTLIDTCKVTLKGEPVSIHRCEITRGLFEKPTGKYGLGYSWRAAGSIPMEASPELKDLSAFDCLQEMYSNSKAYVEGQGWIV